MEVFDGDVAIAIAALYALPNIYGEDPAVRYRARGASVDLSTLDAVTDALKQRAFLLNPLL